MTPRRLNAESVVARLRTMQRLLDHLIALGPVDRARFEQDYDAQLIAERIVSQLVDLAAAINTHVSAARLREAPHDLQQSFDSAAKSGVVDHELAKALAPSAGLRNVLIHAYLDLDVDRFAASVPLAIEQYGRYVQQVGRWLRDQSDAEL